MRGVCGDGIAMPMTAAKSSFKVKPPPGAEITLRAKRQHDAQPAGRPKRAKAERAVKQDDDDVATRADLDRWIAKAELQQQQEEQQQQLQQQQAEQQYQAVCIR